MKRERKERPGDDDIALLTEFDQASTLDYLHADVVDGEHEAACAYEYSREAPVLREAALRSRIIGRKEWVAAKKAARGRKPASDTKSR